MLLSEGVTSFESESVHVGIYMWMESDMNLVSDESQSAHASS